MKSVILGVILLASAVLEAQDLDEIKQKFIGDYELVNYVTFGEDGTKRDMHYIGRLSYDRLGNMAGLGMPIDLPSRAENSSERTIGGFGYWGKVSWDLEAGTVTHHVVGSPMVPQWVGGDNVRYFEFLEDDLLALSIKNSQGRITGTLTWRRLQ
tara:strand:- start:191 stop:652 length:462 start_codon:yes stop_codon:yes gene_type:complete